MKATFNRVELLSAFSKMLLVAPERSPKPILKFVKLTVGGDATSLTATNLEMSLVLGLTATESALGSVLLPRCLEQFLIAAKDDCVNISTVDRKLIVACGEMQFESRPDDAGEFPDVQRFGGPRQKYEVAGASLNRLIDRTAFAADSESSRYALGGVLFDCDGKRLIGVATDGRRLSKIEFSAKSKGKWKPSDDSCIVPSEAIRVLAQLFDGHAGVAIECRTGSISFTGADVSFAARTIEGRFPKWRDVVCVNRNNYVSIQTPVSLLRDTITAVAFVTTPEFNGVEIEFDGSGKLRCSAGSGERGQATAIAVSSHFGEAVSTLIDPKYIMKFLDSLESDDVTLAFGKPDEAIILRTDDGSEYVVMPLRDDDYKTRAAAAGVTHT